jgi:putative ABC transport system ATP-binding protein
MNEAIIRTENLSKVYEAGSVRTPALRGVSLEIPRGSFTAIVGPSGHGKSTLMHLIGGLDRPSGGSVIITGVEIGGLDNASLARLRAGKIGFVFQFFNLLQGFTAAENVEIAMMLAGVPERDQADRAAALLAKVSGGQQQRVAIARALANDPDILLMDEPTGNLDSAAEAGIMKILLALRDQGKTVVIVTHNDEIAGRADRVVRVRDGALSR